MRPSLYKDLWIWLSKPRIRFKIQISDHKKNVPIFSMHWKLRRTLRISPIGSSNVYLKSQVSGESSEIFLQTLNWTWCGGHGLLRVWGWRGLTSRGTGKRMGVKEERRIEGNPGYYTFVRHFGKMGPPSSLLFLTTDGEEGWRDTGKTERAKDQERIEVKWWEEEGREARRYRKKIQTTETNSSLLSS